MNFLKKLAMCATLAAIAVSSIQAQSTPPFRLQQNYITGLTSPILLTNAKDGSNRLFIVQQGGIIRVVQPGSTTPTNFMDITTRVSSGGERGLLGLAFHPQFATNSYFFVNYTRTGDGATVIARFTATNGNTIGDPNSERIVMTIPQPFNNHNGGGIEFGPDGHLYIGMGDGGSGNDPGNRAQNINELLGKFLRITPDVSGNNANPPYTNPADNPYVGVNGADEIYAIGIRNPWRWSFDRETGQLWAGDVGQNQIEEVSIITRGGNFGWRVYEGNQCTGIDPSLCNPTAYTMPVFQYSSSGSRCSITGGYVYRGSQNALPRGSYLYGDYCTGEILLWHNNQQTLLVDSSRSITSFGEDEAGELYVVGSGAVDKLLGSKTSADFDGDLKTDVGVYRPSTGNWHVLSSRSGAVSSTYFGQAGDIPTSKDFDGDSLADYSVFRPSNGTWYYLNSKDNTTVVVPFGAEGDIPVAGDYDGDGKADYMVFRPSTGNWFMLRSSDGQFVASHFGTSGDQPIAGDFDGDGKYDINVFRPSNGAWYRLNSSNGAFVANPWGISGDIPVSGDFDGDNKIDIAVFRPSNGMWYIRNSSNSLVQYISWGLNGDIPVVGDYDGDFKDDVGVFRPSNGTWYIQRSTAGFYAAQFGLNGDTPIPAADRP